jgi:glycosyltransferase involved in cell wall biosynthesis
LRAADLYLAVSSEAARANRLEEAGVRYEVVPNFAADHAPDPAEGRVVAMLPSDPFILQVGDVVADKGVHVLFEAYRHLVSPPPLVLVGRITDAMREALPDGAIATGLWPRAVVSEAWRRALFGTMPSLCLDACPTVTMEAMAAGKPVVASSRGGLVDQVVDRVTGLLMPPGDPAALYEAMSRLVRDLGLRTRLGKAARRRFESTFRADVVIDRIEGLYASLVP